MRKSLLKKISAVACAMVLTVAATTNVFAAEWQSYWGVPGGWYEGADGETKDVTATGFTAFYNTIGWGGVWGCQVYDDTTVNIPAGEEWHISATLQSEDIDKWVFLKITNTTTDGDEPVLFGKWIKLTKGEKVKLDETFTLSDASDKLVFGMGGEFGDRVDEEEIYTYTDTLPNDGENGTDATAYTTIYVTDFTLEKVEAAAEDGTTASNDNDPTTSVVTDNGTTSIVTVDENGVPVQTGDFAPLAFAGIAVVAAAVVVVTTRKKEEM